MGGPASKPSKEVNPIESDFGRPSFLCGILEMISILFKWFQFPFSEVIGGERSVPKGIQRV